MEWTFNEVDRTLSNKEQALRLAPQQTKLLLFLINHAGKVLSREQIIDHVWQDKIVNEDALSRSIANLRSLLGDNTNHPLYIETIPKQGYRFIAPINDSPISSRSLKSLKFGPKFLIAIFSFITLIIINYAMTSDSPQNHINLSQAINNSHRLTADDLVEYQPDISSDGTLISYVYRKDGIFGTRIVSSDGALRYELADPSMHYLSPAIAPNNKSFLIAAYNKDSCQILLVDLPSLNKKQLTTCVAPNESGILDWSINGKQFLYVDAGENNDSSSIWLYDVVNGEKKQLTFNTNNMSYDTRPRFSPDNRHVSFIRGSHSIRNLYKLPLHEPAAIKQLTFTKSFTIGYQWVSSTQIVFDSNKRGDKYLWLLDEDSNSLINIGGKDGQNPSINRQKTTLLYQEKKYQANLWKVNLATQQEEKVISSAKYDNNPNYSPDGSLIAFISNRRGSSDIWLYSTTDKSEDLLLTLANENLVSINWHSSGELLLAGVINDQGYHCIEFDIAQRNIKRIELDTHQIAACQYHPNGKIYALTKPENKPSQLISIKNITEKTIKYMPIRGIANFKVLDNGKLIVAKKNENGLDLLDEDGAYIETLLPDFLPRLSEHWAVKNQSLYFANHDKQNKGTWRLNINTKEKHKLSSSLSTAIGNSMAISPDEKSLIITKLDRIDSDLYLSTIK